MPWGIEAGSTGAISQALTGQGAATVAIEADLAVPDAPARIFDAAERALGNGTALVLCHCESVNSGLLDTPSRASTGISPSPPGPPGC